MSRFGHLRSVRKGDRDWIVPVSLSDYTAPKQRGFVPKGLYGLDVVDADGIPSESGDGVNLHLVLRTAEPPEFAGITVEDFLYIHFDDQIEAMPEGKGKDKAEQLAGISYNKLQHLLRSIASATPGKFEAIQQPGADGKPQSAGVGPAKIMNKRVYAELEPGEKDVIGRDGRTRDFSNTSKIRWYVGREDFEARPGPFPDQTSGATQQSAPELGKGARQGAQQPQQAAPQGGKQGNSGAGPWRVAWCAPARYRHRAPLF